MATEPLLIANLPLPLVVLSVLLRIEALLPITVLATVAIVVPEEQTAAFNITSGSSTTNALISLATILPGY